MFIDDLTERQLEELLAYIGNGPRPTKAGKRLFPGSDHPQLLARALRNYAWNKLTAKHLLRHKDPQWKMYIDIAAGIYCEELEAHNTIDWGV